MPKACKEDKVEYEKFEEMSDPAGDKDTGSLFDEKMSMVFDGLNGDYVYFGRIIAKSVDNDDGFNLSIGSALPARWADDVAKQLKEMKIPNPRNIVVALHVFSHFH